MMKKILTLFMILLFSRAEAQTHWEVLSPQYLTDQFRSSSFISDEEGWVTLESGMVWHTTDGCITWDTVHQGIEFSSIQFINVSLGFAITSDKVYKTIDGGYTWTILSIPPSTYYSLFFLDQDTGFIGGNEMVFKTENGGLTWTSNVFPYGDPVDFHFINDSIGFAVINYSEIYATTDGGISWYLNYENFDDRYYTEIYFVDDELGFACGYDDNFGIFETPIIDRTITGGNNWIWEYEGDDSRIQDIRFRNSTEGYALGPYGLMVSTSNAGASWTESNLDQSGNQMFSIAGMNDLFTFGDGSIYKLPETSSNWQKLFTKFFDNPSQVKFSNSDTGYVLCEDKGLYKTTDAGDNWTFLTSSSSNLRAFDIVGTDFIIGSAYTGSQNKIFLSTDGGQTWTNSYTSCQYCIDAYAIDMIDADTGYIASKDGSVYKTTDGGFNWQGNSLSDQEVRDVHFINSNEGWAIIGGYFEHRIFHTADGGNSWDMQFDTASSIFFTDIYFFDNLHGWVTFSNSCCYDYLVTTDGGLTWNFHDHPQLDESFQFVFSDLQHGYVISSNGDYIYETYNGGITWDTSLALRITGLSITSNERIYAIGKGDGIFARGSNCANFINTDYEFLVTGLTAQFVNAITDATSFYWDFDDGTSSTQQNTIHTFSSSGTYHVCLTESDSCSSDIMCKDVTVCGPVTVDFNYLENGPTVEFTDASVNALTWYWDFGDGNTSSDQNPQHTYALPGIYSVCLISGDDCDLDTLCQTINIISTSTNQFTSEDLCLAVFPNPFSSETTIQFSLSENDEVKIELLDLEGRQIKIIIEENLKAGNYQRNFSAEELPQGTYLVQTKSSRQIRILKIIKQ